ncbi:MAG: hypothetical protein ACLFTA_03285 [Candidatus Nanohaloarchaea archaeon]
METNNSLYEDLLDIFGGKKGESLEEFSGGRTNVFQILLSLHDVKKAVRITVSESQQERLQSLEDVKVSVGSKKDFKDFRRVYVSDKLRKAEEVRKAESESDQRRGEELGYPDCCIENYQLSEASVPELRPVQNSFGPFPWQNNLLLKFHNWSWRVIYHFPCSYSCEKSVKLAERYLDVLEKYEPGLGDKCREKLSSLVILNEDQEILFTPEFKRDGRTFEVENLIFSGSDTSKFSDAEEVRVESYDKVNVDGEMLENGHRAFLFN